MNPNVELLREAIKGSRGPDQKRIAEVGLRVITTLLICEALEGSHGPDQKRIEEIGLQVITTLLKKNADYGGSAWQPPVLCPHLPPRTGILVRLSDKIRRFGNLLAKGKGEVDDEPLEATMLDFAGYSILWLAYPGEADEVPPVRLDQPRTDCDAGSCDCC